MTTFSIGHYLDTTLKKDNSKKSEIKIDSKNSNFIWYKLFVEKRHLDWKEYVTSTPTLLFCLTGEVEIQTLKHRFKLHSGNMILFKPQMTYQVKIKTEETIFVKLKTSSYFSWDRIFSEMGHPTTEEEAVKKSFTEKYKDNGFIKLENNNIMLSNQVLNRAIEEYIQGRMYVTPIDLAYLRLLVFFSFREQFFVTLPTAKTGGFNPEVLTQYIDTNFADISLEDAANYFGFNKNYFSSLVKEKTGQSFMEQVDERRMKEAITLLSDPDISLKEIIKHLGYSSKSFFYKKFNNYFGMTPTEMRKKLIKDNDFHNF
ncbi:helix-turn-helix domain-containing protein [Lactobacillus sp. PV034]|uniref:helix-turn-helix domain-containing protein n=1 Tax=Lactobacillus sp. PV034 TaxID=2594495 RepID=UPI00223E9005|nr:AraC family transcriptional regulator [Lactobacillus sp. PV034]QNQ81071.1 helix-turn-helix transcriptional regulator [Lactobacillus sp. PV034]